MLVLFSLPLLRHPVAQGWRDQPVLLGFSGIVIFADLQFRVNSWQSPFSHPSSWRTTGRSFEIPCTASLSVTGRLLGTHKQQSLDLKQDIVRTYHEGSRHTHISPITKTAFVSQTPSEARHTAKVPLRDIVEPLLASTMRLIKAHVTRFCLFFQGPKAVPMWAVLAVQSWPG